ncbi:D-serine ammonia-lyase [Devosia sp. YIM 151766]|uniref:D-serine ammonia-lyase n=1 Tax=Devosia sp. YIM 151766 TaxID=3017325 RepID=UPI00255CD688|nr:D-serine ammonia-lyase [Devosia sp. YIM 151766]WIY53955.1 D-serine ammonia-lyase [Devosia sp. YIM 151766]
MTTKLNYEERIRSGIASYVPNPNVLPADEAFQLTPSGPGLVKEAVADWTYFAALLAELFPELAASSGRIDSPLLDAHSDLLSAPGTQAVRIKADHLLPVTGTIKARGGIYEVLVYARKLAQKAGLVAHGESSLVLLDPEVRALFAQHSVVTGSTGNLGYSVGLAARTLGFGAEVHMSADAKAWKIERLRKLGVVVHTHHGDFSAAVGIARDAARATESAYFVDDEDSLALFQGYAAAAWDLAAQLDAAGIEVTAGRPLAVYLPCGVGGAPGGVTFGLKSIWGDHVHCILVEPVAAPAVLVQTLAGSERQVSAYDYGCNNQTIADGLAVPSASRLAIQYISRLAAGFVTVADRELLTWVNRAWKAQSLRLEPSAAAGFAALDLMRSDANGPSWFEAATHIVWTTGGAQLPDAEFAALLR